MVYLGIFVMGCIFGAITLVFGIKAKIRHGYTKNPDTTLQTPEESEELQKELLRQYNNLLSYDGSMQRRKTDED